MYGIIDDAYLTSIASAIRSKAGTSDTYTLSQMAAAIEGITGGGSTNILSGQTMPTAQDGEDGSIFLLTTLTGAYDSDFPVNKLSLSEWTKNSAGFTKFNNTYNSPTDENTLDQTGGSGYERVYISVPVESNTDYVFELDFYAPSSIPAGYGGQIRIAVSVASDIDESSALSSTLASENLDRSAKSTYSHYALQFNSGSNASVFLVIDLNITDNTNCVLKFKNFSFHKDGVTPQLVTNNVVIDSVMLKVDGSWVSVEGQAIDDVDTGGGDAGEEVEPTLPSEYQEVEYIDFDGNSYVTISGRALQTNDTFSAVCQRLNNGTSEQGFFGSATGGAGQRFEAFTYETNIGAFARGMDTTKAMQVVSVDSNVRFNMETSTTKDAAVGDKRTVFIMLPFVSGDLKLKIGGYGASGYLCTHRLFKIRHTNSAIEFGDGARGALTNMKQEPVTWYKPCYRKSDDVAGWYDTDAGVFYANEGTGSFTVGPDVS